MVRTAPFSAGGGSARGGQGANIIMKPYRLYILKSVTVGKKYIGIASDLHIRLAKHNSGEVRSTKAYKPWRLIHSESFPSQTDARKRELELKHNGRLRRELFDKIDKVAPSSNG